MRRLLYAGVGALALWIPTTARALEFIQPEYQAAVEESGLGTASPEDITKNVLNWALGFLALVAVILIITGGFMWMTSGGNEEKVKKAKKLLMAAAIGLFIVMAAWGITIYVFQQLGSATGTQFIF